MCGRWRRRWTGCSVRWTSGRCARTVLRTAAPAASPRPGWCWRLPPPWASPARTVVIGDIASDLAAGRAAGAALSLLVPNAATSPDETAAAAPTHSLAPDLPTATSRALAVLTPPQPTASFEALSAPGRRLRTGR
ncbi:HAD hydrolase-like protein [Streptacidiphilus monticola]